MLSLPLVETLVGPVGVGVAGAVLVVSITASRVVGKGGGVAGLSLPPDEPGVAAKGASQTGQTSTSIGQGTKTNQGEGTNLPLVKAVSTLGGPVGVGVARAILVVSVTASRVVGKGGGIAGLSLPLVVAMASNGEAVAIVLGGVAVAVSGVAVVGEGT